MHLQLQPFNDAFDHWCQVGDLVGICFLFAWGTLEQSSPVRQPVAWILFVYAAAYTALLVGVMSWRVGRKLVQWLGGCCSEQDPPPLGGQVADGPPAEEAQPLLAKRS